MKQKNNIILKLFALGIFFFCISCHDDEYSIDKANQDSKSIFSKINFEDVPKLKSEILKDKQTYSHVLNMYKTNNSAINYFDKIIPTHINSQIYDLENNLHYYTFGLDLVEVNQKTNLVVKETASGNKYYIYIFKPTNYQEWETAIHTNDKNYREKIDIDFFEIQLSAYTTASEMCLETTEVWTCPYGLHRLGEGDWTECRTFGSGGAGVNSWVRSYTTEMVSCGGMGGDGSVTSPPIDDGSNPAPGGGTNNPNEIVGAVPNFNIGLTNESPCQNLEEQLKENKDKLKKAIDSLKTLTHLPVESSASFKKYTPPDEPVEYIQEWHDNGTTNSATIIFGTFYYGSLHTHPDNTYPMFSWVDIRKLSYLYEDTKPEYKKDVFLGIVCSNGEVYNLKVDNLTQLNMMLDNDWNNPDYDGDTDDEKLDKIEEMIKEIYESDTDIEKSFLKRFNNYGFSVYKANSDVSSWVKLGLSEPITENSQVIKTPCN